MKKITILILMILTFTNCQTNSEKKNIELIENIKEKSFAIKDQFEQYKIEFSKTNIQNFLTISRLEKDTTLEESKAIIENCEKVLREFRIQNEKSSKNLISTIDSLKPSRKFSENFIKELRNDYKEVFNDNRKNYISDSLGINLFKKTMGILEECEYVIQDERVLFYNGECKNKFNRIQMQISFLQTENTINEFNKDRKKLNSILKNRLKSN